MIMKQKCLFEFLSLILFSLLLISGCEANSITPVSPNVTLAISPTLTVTPTRAPSLIGTETPSPTVTLAPSPTFTLGLTLTEEEVRTNVNVAMKTNGGCDYPCWWGIIPGETHQEDAFALLAKIGLAPRYDPAMGGFNDIWWFNGLYGGQSINFDIYVTDKVVTYIHLWGLGNRDKTMFQELWNSDSPESIVTKYGTPTRVWIESYFSTCEGNGPCTSTPYKLWLFYDKQGFFIIYSGFVDLKSTYTFCPTFNDDGNLSGKIEIYLKSSSDNKALEDFPGLPSGALEDPKDFVSITGISLDEFSAHYKQPNQSFCFSTPRDIWP